MSVDPNTFREAMSRWASGVSVVTSRDGEQPVGLTVSACISLSISPPLVLVSIHRQSRSLAALLWSRRFAVNILAEGQEELSQRFATRQTTERFGGDFWYTAATGAPVLAAALTWLDCELIANYDGGDHLILIGHVLTVGIAPAGRRPLLYYHRAYHQLQHAPDELAEEDRRLVTAEYGWALQPRRPAAVVGSPKEER